MTNHILTPQQEAFRFFKQKIRTFTIKLYQDRKLIDQGSLQELAGTDNTWAKVGTTEFRISEIEKMNTKRQTITLK